MNRYRIVTAGGDAFEGNVHAIDPPKNFSGTAENKNTALLSVWLDDLPMRGYKDVNLWLSTYGVPQADVDTLKARWDAMLKKLFACIGGT